MPTPRAERAPRSRAAIHDSNENKPRDPGLKFLFTPVPNAYVWNMSEEFTAKGWSRPPEFLTLTLMLLTVNAFACSLGLTTGSTSPPPIEEPPSSRGASTSGTSDDDKELQIADWAQLPDEHHPIVGTFRYRDERCTETHSYRSDGTSTSISGEERLESHFRIAPQALPNGVYRYVTRIIQTNSVRDCWGNVTPVGHQVVRFVGFRNGFRSLWLCWDEAGTDCFGPLWRIEARVTHE